MPTSSKNTHERGDLALRQGVVLRLAGRADQILQAVGPAIYLAAGDLDRPQILDDSHHGVEAVARHRVAAPHELTLLVVLPPVAKHGHDQIVHSFDLDPTTQGLLPDRLLDALVGSGVALSVSALFPNDPRRMVERAVQPIFGELIDMLGETTAALHTDDLELAEHALGKARGIDTRMNRLKEALAAGYGTARLSPPRRRRDLGYLANYAAVADQLDLAVRNTRVLTRAAVDML